MTFKNYKEGDSITKAEYDALNNALSIKQKPNSKKLEENKTVFFDKSVQTSRTEFKKHFPTNKIVSNIKDGYYYITNNRPSCYLYFQQRNVLKFDKSDFNWRLKEKIVEVNKMVDFANSEVVILSPEAIKFNYTNEDLPVEMHEKIINMLSSSDKETFDLGWKILFEYNHLNCINDFYLIISKSNPGAFWKRTKSRITESKLKQIKSHFPNSRF